MSPQLKDTDFAVSVAQHPALQLVGLKIRTTMQECHKDCPALWQETFMPWIRRFYPEGDCPSWGLSFSWNAATGGFDYCAAIQLPQNTPIPKGLKQFQIPAGLYAICQLNSIAEIHTAYHYLYSRWLPSQTRYIALEDAPSFEYCQPDFLQTGRLSIYIPVIEK